MATVKEIEKLGNRNPPSSRTPIEPLALEPLPMEITRAFPKMGEWEKKSNARIAEWVRRLNTVVPN